MSTKVVFDNITIENIISENVTFDNIVPDITTIEENSTINVPNIIDVPLENSKEEKNKMEENKVEVKASSKECVLPVDTIEKVESQYYFWQTGWLIRKIICCIIIFPTDYLFQVDCWLHQDLFFPKISNWKAIQASTEKDVLGKLNEKNEVIENVIATLQNVIPNSSIEPSTLSLDKCKILLNSLKNYLLDIIEKFAGIMFYHWCQHILLCTPMLQSD